MKSWSTQLERWLADLEGELSDPHSEAPEWVHRTRVLTRRVRAGAALGVRGGALEPATETQRRLRKLGKRLGEVREWDVLLLQARQRRWPVGVLRRERRRSARRLQKWLERTRGQSLRKKLSKLKGAVRKASPLDRGAVREWLGARSDRVVCQPENKAQWHQVRIQLKKLRYSLELLNGESKGLRTLQRLVGEAHDLEVLGNYFSRQAEVSEPEARLLKSASSLLPKELSRIHRALTTTVRP